MQGPSAARASKVGYLPTVDTPPGGFTIYALDGDPNPISRVPKKRITDMLVEEAIKRKVGLKFIAIQAARELKLDQLKKKGGKEWKLVVYVSSTGEQPGGAKPRRDVNDEILPLRNLNDNEYENPQGLTYVQDVGFTYKSDRTIFPAQRGVVVFADLDLEANKNAFDVIFDHPPTPADAPKSPPQPAVATTTASAAPAAQPRASTPPASSAAPDLQPLHEEPLPAVGVFRPSRHIELIVALTELAAGRSSETAVRLDWSDEIAYLSASKALSLAAQTASLVSRVRDLVESAKRTKDPATEAELAKASDGLKTLRAELRDALVAVSEEGNRRDIESLARENQALDELDRVISEYGK